MRGSSLALYPDSVKLPVKQEMTNQPIVLTGASGFLARHVLQRLLADGHHVRATLRSLSRADEVRAAVLHGLPADAGGRLEFVPLDLLAEAGWDAALAGRAR